MQIALRIIMTSAKFNSKYNLQQIKNLEEDEFLVVHSSYD